MRYFYKPLSAILAAGFFFVQAADAQVINLFAGNHTSGYTGNNGPATAAECYAPAGIAADAAGNIYISDLGKSVIRKVTTDGVIHTIAGTGVAGFGGDGGPATAAQLNQPTSVAVDAAGNVYLTDDNNNRVRKIDLSGNINTIAGNGTAGYSGDGFAAVNAELNAPSGVAVDRYGNVYIADANNFVIRKVIDSTGKIFTYAGEGSAGYSGDGSNAGIAQFNYPSGVAVDTLNNVFVADKANSMVRKIYPTGLIIRYAGDTSITGNPVFGYSGDGGYANVAQLNSPTEIALAPDGTLYIADYNNHRIRKVKTNGDISTCAGSGVSGYSPSGTPALSAQLAGPFGVTVAPNGKIYITDEINNVAQVIDVASAVEEMPLAAARLSVYPNPSSGSFTIDVPGNATAATITIANITGHTIATRNVTQASGKIAFTLDGVPAGTYMLSVNTGSTIYHEQIAVW